MSEATSDNFFDKYEKFVDFVMGEMGDTELDVEPLRQFYAAAEKEGITPMPTWDDAADALLPDDEAEEDDKEEDEAE